MSIGVWCTGLAISVQCSRVQVQSDMVVPARRNPGHLHARPFVLSRSDSITSSALCEPTENKLRSATACAASVYAAAAQRGEPLPHVCGQFFILGGGARRLVWRIPLP